MFIFPMEMMTSYFANVSLVPSLELSISLSMDYLAHLNHHKPENFVGCGYSIALSMLEYQRIILKMIKTLIVPQ